MARFLHSVGSFCTRKWDKLFLALSWVTGLAVGGFVFRYSGSILVSQMPLAVRSQPSIFPLLICMLLPFLFSAYAVYIAAPRILYGICFLRAWGLGYLSCCVFAAFGNTGWLVRWLFLFSDIFAAAALYCYCHRYISGVRKLSSGGFTAYAGIIAAVSLLDYSVISRLLLRVLGT